MSKHFNAGNVWGRVASVKADRSQDRGTPFLAITIECPNEMFGNLKTYGRLWGRDKMDAFMDYHKKNPGASYRFQGFFSQYDKDGKRNSNFTFFSWSPSDAKEFRAAFVLVGEVRGSSKVEGDGKLLLHLIREGKNGYEDTEEDFEVYTLNAQEVNGIEDGALVEAKGVLRFKQAEDYFGGSTDGTVKPYVMELKVRKVETSDEEKEPY